MGGRVDGVVYGEWGAELGWWWMGWMDGRVDGVVGGW